MFCIMLITKIIKYFYKVSQRNKPYSVKLLTNNFLLFRLCLKYYG